MGLFSGGEEWLMATGPDESPAAVAIGLDQTTAIQVPAPSAFMFFELCFWDHVEAAIWIEVNRQRLSALAT